LKHVLILWDRVCSALEVLVEATKVCNPTTSTAGFADNECTGAPFTLTTGFKNSDRYKAVEFFLEELAMSKWHWVSTGGMWNSIIEQLEMDFVVGVGTEFTTTML